MRGDRVLVTGASGFVGSAVARALQARGAQVVCLVRQSSPRGNLEELHADIKGTQEEDFEKEQDHYKQTTDGTWLKQREDQVEAQIEATYLQERDALMDLLLAWVGDVARIQAGAEHLDLQQYREATKALAERWTTAETTRRIHVLRKLEQHLHTNVNEALALEVAFIQAFGR